jgi:hypothetical protein
MAMLPARPKTGVPDERHGSSWRSRSRAGRVFTRTCVVLWRWGWVVAIPLLTQAAVGFVFSVLVTPPEWIGTLQQSPAGWLLRHTGVLLGATVTLVSVGVIIYFGSHPSLARRHGVIGAEYLQRVVREHQQIALTGVPAKLISESVRLDAVFVPMAFWSARPLSDYPLDPSEIAMLRSGVAGRDDREVDAILADAERSWHRLLSKGSRHSLADIWATMTLDSPTLVIQGFPGSGKSTLISRLALFLARRRLGRSDDLADAPVGSAVPVVVLLREFAEARTRDPKMGLSAFISAEAQRWNIDGVAEFLAESLRDGRCVVLMDGLDEISSVGDRRAAHEEITTFIKNHSGAPGRFNRFVITSRIAGYDQHAFPDATHVTTAEFDIRQIDSFLNQWSKALRQRDPAARTPYAEVVTSDIHAPESRQAERLRELISNHPTLIELAGNPLLLALLVVMQYNDVPVPLRRSEIYRTIVRTMLEDRNYASQLPVVGEQEAIAKLGPLAVDMHESSNSLARRSTVVTMVATATREQATLPEVDRFLDLVRERGGVFARRTNEYYGFSHRIFQEYFAARQLLTELLSDLDGQLSGFIERGLRPDQLWREPFILAVAYAGEDYDSDVVSRVLSGLLDAARDADGAPSESAVILAAECLVDLRAGAVSRALESTICERLLAAYHRSYASYDWLVASRIENAAHRLVLSVPRRGQSSTFAEQLQVCVAADGAHLRSAVTLLAMIAGEVGFHAAAPVDRHDPLSVFIPVLMSRAGLPADSHHTPLPAVGQDSGDVVDLSITALSMLGPAGPAGLALPVVQEHFTLHPERMELLAQLSIVCASLLTPTVAPVRVEANKRYQTAIRQWRQLLTDGSASRLTHGRLSEAVDVHGQLLRAADQIRFPVGQMLVDLCNSLVEVHAPAMVDRAKALLRHTLDTTDYLGYRNAMMLWTAMFTDATSLKELGDILVRHFAADGPRMVYAEAYLAMLADDKSVPQYARYMQQLVNNFSLDRHVWRNPDDLRDLYRLRDLQALRGLDYTRFNEFMCYLGYLRGLRGLHFMKGARLLEPAMFAQPQIAEIALTHLKALLAADTLHRHRMLNLLSILRSWIKPLPTDDEVPAVVRPAAVCELLGDVLAKADSRDMVEIALLTMRSCIAAQPSLHTYPSALAMRIKDPQLRDRLHILAERAEPLAE